MKGSNVLHPAPAERPLVPETPLLIPKIDTGGGK